MERRRNQLRFRAAAQEADTLVGLAYTRLRGLVTGLEHVRRDFQLWTYLRTRSYARHAAAMAVAATHARPDDPRERERMSNGLEAVLKPWAELTALEVELQRSGFFIGDWLADALIRQLEERDVRARIEEIARLFVERRQAPVPLGLLNEDDQADLRATIRLRNDARAICAELEGLLPGQDSLEIVTIAVERRGYPHRLQDRTLARLVHEQPALAEIARDLLDRFYERPAIETHIEERGAPDDLETDLTRLGLGSVLLEVRDLPWLSGDIEATDWRRSWWI